MTDITEAAAQEAVQHLGLLTSAAIPTVVNLLSGDMHEHPRAISTAYRKEGAQISDDEKKALAIRRNSFLSRAALAEISPTGLNDPLSAHEKTLLRATFTLNRHRIVAQEERLHAHMGECFIGFRHDGLTLDCPGCSRIDGMVTSAADALVFPPADCICPTAGYGIAPSIDWLAGVD